jgi:cell division protein FtsX
VFIIFGYIATVLVLIISVIFGKNYMHKNQKAFVKGTPPPIQKRSFMNTHPVLIILVLTPILFAIAWFIGWMLSR